MELNDLFKNRLRELRKEKKETQVQVAQAIGTTGRYYQKLESGESLPGLAYCCALADHFGVTIDYLACRTDEK